MTDPTQTRQPTQEELEAHLAQLREADVAEVVAQAVNMLATGAQVKLGRTDARVLIDAIIGVADAAEGRVHGELVRQIRDAVSQLQMAQVQAERESGGAEPGDTPGAAEGPRSGAGQPGGGRPGGAGAGPGGPRGGPAGQTGQAGSQAPGPPGGGQRMTDRLWIPGREPGPG
jgi:hypothetical protein